MTLEIASIYALLSTIVISLISLVGILTLFINKKYLYKSILPLVSLAAGTMMGAVFFHLLPEASQIMNTTLMFQLVVGSFILFFLIEKFLHWQHCHKEDCVIHSVGYMNLIGDGLHNFLDGMVIAGAYLIDVRLGFITTLSVILHEIPQELGDFGVLLHSGFKTNQALMFNLLSAVTALIGTVIGLIFLDGSNQLATYILPVAAGGFLYISASDLLPEIKEEPVGKRLAIMMILFLVGVLLMLVIS